jgi:hypothetical protein
VRGVERPVTLGGEEGAVAVERVVKLADRLEDATGGAQARSARHRLLGRCEQIGVLREQDLDDEEQGRVEQRKGLGDRQRDRGGA